MVDVALGCSGGETALDVPIGMRWWRRNAVYGNGVAVGETVLDVTVGVRC